MLEHRRKQRYCQAEFAKHTPTVGRDVLAPSDPARHRKYLGHWDIRPAQNVIHASHQGRSERQRCSAQVPFMGLSRGDRDCHRYRRRPRSERIYQNLGMPTCRRRSRRPVRRHDVIAGMRRAVRTTSGRDARRRPAKPPELRPGTPSVGVVSDQLPQRPFEPYIESRDSRGIRSRASRPRVI
jgi:hypothetical protein